MIEFKTSKGVFVVVDIQNEYSEFYNITQEYGFISSIEDLPEEYAKLIVDEHEYPWLEGEYCYPDYEVYGKTGFKAFDTALESLHSLLKSKGIYINNGNWYLFKKI